MEELNLKCGGDKFLTLDKEIIHKTLTLRVGYDQRYEINKEDAKEMVEHLTKVFEL